MRHPAIIVCGRLQSTLWIILLRMPMVGFVTQHIILIDCKAVKLERSRLGVLDVRHFVKLYSEENSLSVHGYMFSYAVLFDNELPIREVENFLKGYQKEASTQKINPFEIQRKSDPLPVSGRDLKL